MANEDKATRYHRLQRRVSLASTALGITLLAFVAVTGASAALARSLEGAVGSAYAKGAPARVVVTVAFVLVLLALHEILDFPLAFYRGVTLERRYGLSSETTGHWLRTHLKGLGVGALLTTGTAVIVSVLLVWSPDRWWLIATALFTGLLIGVVFAAPVWLFPLFYDFAPLERPALNTRLVALARQAGTSVSGVFEWRLGDRTRKANAALAGIGRTRRILLSDTLLATHSEEEVEVIVAHELAHHVYGDVWSGIALQSAVGALGLYAADGALDAFAVPLGLTGRADVAGLPVVALAAGAVSLVLAPIGHAISRAHERRADRFAIQLTRNASAFMSAIRRLAAQNLAEETPSPWVEALFHSHPSTTRRLEAARRWTGHAPLASSVRD